MPREVVVNVTEEDIKKGIRASCILCPVARAIKRATGWQFTVGRICCRFNDYIIDLPEACSGFIADFDDQWRRVHPFFFILTLPDNFPLPGAAANG